MEEFGYEKYGEVMMSDEGVWVWNYMKMGYDEWESFVWFVGYILRKVVKLK